MPYDKQSLLEFITRQEETKPEEYTWLAMTMDRMPELYDDSDIKAALKGINLADKATTMADIKAIRAKNNFGTDRPWWWLDEIL